MAKLPDNVKDLLQSGHNVWVATVGSDGWPNVAIKGSGAFLDNEHIYFADIFSKKTRQNLLHSNKVAVGIFNRETRVALQVKGHATLLDSGDLFKRVSEEIDQRQSWLPPVKYVVQIEIEAIYDMSAGPNAGERIA